MRGLWLISGLAILFTGCEWTYDRNQEVPSPPVPPQVPTPTPTPVPPEEETSGLPIELELEELRTVIRTLAEENQRLRSELADALQAEVVRPQPVEPPATPTPPAPTPTPDADLASILYVNPNWHYLTFNRGSDHGFRARSQIEILRDGAPIASATITSVKPGQADADIDVTSLGSSGFYPREKDTVRKK